MFTYISKPSTKGCMVSNSKRQEMKQLRNGYCFCMVKKSRCLKAVYWSLANHNPVQIKLSFQNSNVNAIPS